MKTEYTAEEILEWAENATVAGPVSIDRETAAHLAKCTRLYAAWEIRAKYREQHSNYYSACSAHTLMDELAEAIDDE